MKIAIRISWAIIIDHNIDTFNINTTTKNIGCNKNTLFERFKSGISINTLKEYKFESSSKYGKTLQTALPELNQNEY